MNAPTDDAVLRLLDALERGELSDAELSARQLGSFLGRTTGHLYHHWGSLDGFLFAVSQAGLERLGSALLGVTARGGSLADLCADFVEYGIEHPALYGLMFERRYDWAALRARGASGTHSPGMTLWRAVTAQLAALGAREPTEDARLLFSGLHGLVSMALSGRANIGVLEQSDRDVAVKAARRLAALVCPPSPQEVQHARRSTTPARKPQAAEPARQGRAQRKPGHARRRSK